MKARKNRSGFLHYAYVLGVGGWLLVIPIVAGAALGRYLDNRVDGGISWTLTCTLAGVLIGLYNAWYFYVRKME